jgi:hypothetical protein
MQHVYKNQGAADDALLDALLTEPNKSKLAYTASNPDGYRVEIRETSDGFSLFTWHDKRTAKSSVTSWKETHGLAWENAFSMAAQWLKTELFKMKPAKLKKEQFFFAEITDTFGGDANYSWVTRHKIKANTARGAICKLSKESGLSWRKNYDTGDTVRYDSKSGATCVFISEWDETEHAEYRLNEI